MNNFSGFLSKNPANDVQAGFKNSDEGVLVNFAAVISSSGLNMR